jgi:hypothetical protein
MSRLDETKFEDEKQQELELEHGVGSEQERQHAAALARKILFKIDTRYDPQLLMEGC